MESETEASSPTHEQSDGAASESIWSHQPDTLLLQQYFDDRRGKTSLEPEKRLMLAILADALQCFQENAAARNGKRKQLFDNVQSWFSDLSSDWVFGFENICNVLGFSPEYVRAGLARWREKESAKRRGLPLWKNAGKAPERSVSLARRMTIDSFRTSRLTRR